MQEKNEKQKGTTFGGAQFSVVERLFGGLAVNETLLYAGGIVLRRRAEDAQQQEKDEIRAFARTFLARHYYGPSAHSAELVLDKVYSYDMLLSIDFESAWGYEVGVYDRSSRVLEERYWREGAMGQLVAISSAGATKHQLIINFDAQHRPSIVMHTFQQPTGSVSVSAGPEVSQTLRVLTYNVWNVNPPAYAAKSPAARWKRYTERMNYLCEVIRAQNADVLLLQEVRLDTSFRGSKIGSGSQLELLLECLVERRWQFIFAPAMSMADKGTYSKARLEEGLAILTSHNLDPGSIEVLLLPRNLVDASDDHSRMVLRATVSTPEKTRIDAMTTHFPLSPASRKKAVDFIFASPASAGHLFQVLAGDLNAEPFDECLQSLTAGSSRPFVDAWLYADGDEDGFTFPACRPVKRIDYALVRNSSVACGVVRNVAIVGQQSKEEEAIGDRITTRPETGMLDDDSLLWASDHYGLRVDLVLLPRCHLDGHVADEL